MGFAPSSVKPRSLPNTLSSDAKFALLYQNDDLGKDFVNGLVTYWAPI
jgi:branched-chain amino acid transport system substrate-binding protein